VSLEPLRNGLGSQVRKTGSTEIYAALGLCISCIITVAYLGPATFASDAGDRARQAGAALASGSNRSGMRAGLTSEADAAGRLQFQSGTAVLFWYELKEPAFGLSTEIGYKMSLGQP
jgi:hypothetical protein